ncbi:MAG: ABC transporter permease subunit [Acidimicrobiaceae bacterium]|nr:ABC transporter permease subunit [Acidimicrobiaceae bacterium]
MSNEMSKTNHSARLTTNMQRARKLLLLIAPLMGVTVFLVSWEVYVRVSGIRPLILPRPSVVIGHIVEHPAFYWKHGSFTLLEASAGFFLAFFVAVFVATLMVHSEFMQRATMPVVVIVQSMPVVVLLPLFLLWFGFSPWPKIITAMLFTWVPFVTNALTGLRSVDTSTHELFKSVNATRWEIYWRLRIPNSLPYLFSAGRVCVGLALMGAVVAEFFLSKDGLGHTAYVAYSRLLVEQLWGSVIVLAFMGVTIVLLLNAVEQKMLYWHPSQHERNHPAK